MAQATQQAQPVDINAAYVEARGEHAAGRIDLAKRLYGEILARVPHHAESLTMLGSIAHQEGDAIQAEAYLDRAIRIYRAVVEQMPNHLKVRAALVNLLLARDQADEAEKHVVDLDLPFNPIRATADEFAGRQKSAIGRKLPVMLLNTMPKSASESIWNKIAEGLEMPQAHLSMGVFPDCCVVPRRVAAAGRGGMILKEHLMPTPFNLRVLASAGVDRVVCHVRDPRQATLSWAHFSRDDVGWRLMGPIWRKVVPPVGGAMGDLGEQIDWALENFMPWIVRFAEEWKKVQDDEAAPVKVMFTSFEDFREAPADYFDRVLDFYGIDRSLFAAEADAEVVHLRKGEKDEWREVFSTGQRKRAWGMLSGPLADAFGWKP